MQDTLLRVLMVGLSLLMHPRDDPVLEEWCDITTGGLQKHEEMLLRGGDKLNHEMAPVNEEVTHTDNKVPPDEVKSVSKNPSDQHVAEKDAMQASEDVTVTTQDVDGQSADHKLHFIGNLDPSLQQIETAAALKTEVDHERMREGIQPDTTFSDQSRPKGEQEEPEEKGFTSKEEPLLHPHAEISENKTSEKAIADWERDYLWYIWNTFSTISMIRLLWKYLKRSSQSNNDETRAFPVSHTTAVSVALPDSNTLQQFHSKCIRGSSSHKKWREEFLEGFVSDLLDEMRILCDRNGSMLMDDFQIVDACNIIVPFRPSDQNCFQFLLWNNQQSDLQPDLQVCGQIKLVEKKVQNGCHCQSSDAEDTVCLLHCATEKAKKTRVSDSLCMKNSLFLSKSQVNKWFLSTIKQAWALISHKYEFYLNIHFIDAPSALVVRFRSGKSIHFSMNPVVRFNTDAHFFIPPWSPNNFDTFWTLSLTNYEDHYLDCISKRLPKNSCHSQTLDIAHFLHRRQTALSGSSALKDSHFKNALMHLLLTRDPSQWKPNNVTCRLRDLLDFMEKSLDKKLLNHVLIGNPLATRVIELPVEFTQAKAVNLFHPLVVHKCIYKHAVMHFQEMLQNAHMLIGDHVDQCPNSATV